MYRFTVSTACLIFFVTSALSPEARPTKEYVPATTNLSNKPATEWISKRSSVGNGSIPRRTFRSKRRPPSVVLFLNANITRSAGGGNESFPYFQALLASYEDTSEEDDGCQSDGGCQALLKNSLCLKEANNRTRCYCPPGYYIDTSKKIHECAEKDKRYECTDSHECQQYLKRSVCDVTNSGSKCRCLIGYVRYDNNRECLEMVSLGDRCKSTLQCPANSFCTGYACVCKNGYVKKGDECVEKSPVSGTQNFLLVLIAGVICLIVIACLLVTFLSIRRKIRNALRHASSDRIPTISSQIDAREPFSPDSAYERIDKPPSYEEAMSSSALVLTPNIEDITPAPPPYSQAQEQRRNVNNTSAI